MTGALIFLLVTVVIMVTPDVVIVQGEAVIKTLDLLEVKADTVDEITERLQAIGYA